MHPGARPTACDFGIGIPHAFVQSCAIIHESRFMPNAKSQTPTLAEFLIVRMSFTNRQFPFTSAQFVLNSWHCALFIWHYAFGIVHYSFGIRHSAFGIIHLTFRVDHSPFCIPHLAFGIHFLLPCRYRKISSCPTTPTTWPFTTTGSSDPLSAFRRASFCITRRAVS